MPKDEWGTKRVCPNCGTRFYDLCRDPMTCPACGHSFDLAALLSGKSTVTTPPKSIGPMPDSGLDHDAEVLDDDDTDVDLDDIADVAAEDDDE